MVVVGGSGSGSGSGDGAHDGECRVRVGEASTHEGVRGSGWCWCLPVVRHERGWKSGAAIVGGVCGEGGFGERSGIRMDEGSKGVVVVVQVTCRSSSSQGVRTGCILKREALIVSDAGREGTSGERRRVWSDEGSKGIIVRVGCRSCYSQGVRVGCSLERKTPIVSGAGRESTSSERRKVWIDEGSKGVVIRMAYSYGCF